MLNPFRVPKEWVHLQPHTALRLCEVIKVRLFQSQMLELKIDTTKNLKEV